MDRNQILNKLGGVDEAEKLLINLPKSTTHFNHVTGQQLMQQTPNIWLGFIDNDIDMYNRERVSTPNQDDIFSVIEISLAVYEAKYKWHEGCKCCLFCTKSACYFEQSLGKGRNSFWTVDFKEAHIFNNANEALKQMHDLKDMQDIELCFIKSNHQEKQ